MTKPRIEFQEYGLNSVATFRFYEDRIEHDWKELTSRGHDVYPTSNILGEISELTTFAYGVGQALKRFALFITAGLVLHLGFDRPALHYVGFAFYVMTACAGVLAIMRTKKDTWLYVKKLDGSTLFQVREKGLRGINREQLIQEIRYYTKPG
jgi:hypothetical protein